MADDASLNRCKKGDRSHIIETRLREKPEKQPGMSHVWGCFRRMSVWRTCGQDTSPRIVDWPKAGSPEFRTRDIGTCIRSMTPERRPDTRLTYPFVLSSPSPNKVDTLIYIFRSSILSLYFPLSTLNLVLADGGP